MKPMSEQLLLFHMPRSDIDEISEDLEIVIEKLDRYRKSMHAKLSTLSSEVRTLQARLDIQDAQMYILKSFIEKYVDKELEKDPVMSCLNF